MEDVNAAKTCQHFVTHKKRLCKMLVKSGQTYCGQHLINEGVYKEGFLRIPCPLDPKHSCFKHRLERHLKTCNARERFDIPYKTKDINMGDNVEEPSPIKLIDLSDEALHSFIANVKKIHLEHVGEIQKHIQSHPCMQSRLSEPSYGPSVIRHLKQNDSILGFLNEKGFLNEENEMIFLEFGAGRGQLTNFLIEGVADLKKSTFFLVDRGAQRYRFDAKLRYNENVELKRLRIDIQDLDLCKLEELKEDAVLVSFGKHLCGAATDLSLRCLNQPIKTKFGGLIIALCCHHRLTWASYTGKEFFQEIGLRSDDFPILRALTSWAVCGAGFNDKKPVTVTEEEHTPNEDLQDDKGENRYLRMGLSLSEREEIGRKAKQIFDFGRVDYLRRNNVDAQLIKYVDKEHTLENIALIAMPHKV